ncbi:MAG: hypothetical protein AAF196_00970 [Planctomycetota bacterium]
MSQREYEVPVPQDANGDVHPRNRAAAIRHAVKNYTETGTVEIQAAWDEDRKVWDLTLTDED